jgi:HSP90 family molecular chaperone
VKKKKPITEAERRQQLEVAAAHKRAEEARMRENAEQEKIQLAMNAYEGIWREFAKNSKKSKSQAYAQLKEDLATFAPELVPVLMTAKEHMSLIAEAETHVKGDGPSSQEDPRSIVSQWLQGKIELSRIPLEKAVVNEQA